MFALEMDYCAPIGLAHSRFTSWSQADQDAALAWTIITRTRCQLCGTDPMAWMDEEGYPIEPPPYRVRTRKCLGCVALDEERERMRNEIGTEGITPYLERVPGGRRNSRS